MAANLPSASYDMLVAAPDRDPRGVQVGEQGLANLREVPSASRTWASVTEPPGPPASSTIRRSASASASGWKCSVGETRTARPAARSAARSAPSSSESSGGS